MSAETLSIRQAASACGMAYETFRKRWRRMVADEDFPQPFHGHIWDAGAVIAWRQARSQAGRAVYTRPRLVSKPPVDDQQRALAGLRAIRGY